MSQTENTIVQYAAIDLGYFQTKYVALRPRDQDCTVQILPSVAPVIAEVANQRDSTEYDKGFHIQMGGKTYYVGSDALDKGGYRTVAEDFCRTPEYKAVFLGTLAHMARYLSITNDMTIEVMVVGLPAANHGKFKEHLVAMTKGVHTIPAPDGGRMRVTIQEVACMMQPIGAIKKATDLEGLDFLVIDVGGGTVDWCGLLHGKSDPRLRDSHRNGLLECAKEGLKVLKSSYAQNPRLVDAFAQALTSDQDFSFSIGGVELPRDRAAAAYAASVAVAAEALKVMTDHVRDLEVYHHIVFTGGGGNFFCRVFLEQRPELAAKVLRDGTGVLSIVEGFFLWAGRLHAGRIKRLAA